MLWYPYRTVSYTSRRDSSKKAQLMTGQYSQKCVGNRYLSKEKIQQCFEKDSLLLPRSQLCRASDIPGRRWYSRLVQLVRQWQLLRRLLVSRLCSCSCSCQSTPYAQPNYYPKVVSMAKPNESTMKRAIRLFGECYSIHRLNPSVGSSDRFYFQNLSESSNINFHDHSSSSTLPRGIVLVLFKIQRGK